MTACAGFAGVDGTLCRTMRSSASSNAKKSVKVPPTSTPIIQAIPNTSVAAILEGGDAKINRHRVVVWLPCAVARFRDNACKRKRMTWVGQSIERVEDAALLTGRGRYIDDLAVPPGCLHAVVMRSPHPHAAIRSIDVSAAKR